MTPGADTLSWVPGALSPTEGHKLSPRQAAPHFSGWSSRSPFPSPHLVSFSVKKHPSPSTQTWCPACSPSSNPAQNTYPPSVDMPHRYVMVRSWASLSSSKSFLRTCWALLTWVLSIWSSLAQSRCFMNIHRAESTHLPGPFHPDELPTWSSRGACGFELRVPLSLFELPSLHICHFPIWGEIPEASVTES